MICPHENITLNHIKPPFMHIYPIYIPSISRHVQCSSSAATLGAWSIAICRSAVASHPATFRHDGGYQVTKMERHLIKMLND
jgi:hypothetical protein